MRYFACFILLFCSSFSMGLSAYELTIVQTVSKTGKTFITRTGKKDGIIVGKKATFTSNNVSVIAQAIEVTRYFTQWKIENESAKIPFEKGEIVTFYDAGEYLWALSPEEVKSKYIKSEVFAPRLSLAGHVSLFRGLSASVSEAVSESEQRGGLVFEGLLQRELNKNFAVAGGFRYTSEVISLPEASLTTNRFLAIGQLQYYFDKMRQFYNARIGLGLGLGLGQSQTSAEGQTSSGTASILPMTNVSLNFPFNKDTEFVLETAFESVRVEEEFEDGSLQTTNTDNLRYGLALRRYLD